MQSFSYFYNYLVNIIFFIYYFFKLFYAMDFDCYLTNSFSKTLLSKFHNTIIIKYFIFLNFLLIILIL